MEAKIKTRQLNIYKIYTLYNDIRVLILTIMWQFISAHTDEKYTDEKIIQRGKGMQL